jgi:hypothetical protein
MENKISIREAMKTAFPLWKKHFTKIAIAGFIVYLPTQICIELVSVQLEKIWSIEDPRYFRLANNIYELIRMLIGSVAMLGIINFTIKILKNEEEQSVKQIVLHGLKKWAQFIGISILVGLKIFLYLLLLIIPGIYKSVRLTFIDCIVATNDDNSLDELAESERLVKNRWWKVFGFLLAMFFLALLVELLFLPFLLINLDSHILSVVLGISASICTTYFIVVRAVYYFTLKNVVSNEEVVSNEKTERKINPDSALEYYGVFIEDEPSDNN